LLDLLVGLRVVECPAFVAAPLCGNVLAQLGADVIRIDPLHGGLDQRRWPVNETGQSLYWAGLNSAKRSVAIDLQSSAGRTLAKALITAPGEGAGIFSTNLAPEWARYDELRAARPDLIMLSIEGHPDGGSAVDYTVNAETGLPFLTGTGGTPVNHSLPAWDITTGLHGALALLSAERRRRQSGEGAHLRLALSDVALGTMSALAYTSEVEVNGRGRGALGNYVYGTFGRDFSSRDGHRIMIVAVTKRQWLALGKATGLEVAFADAEKNLGLDFADEGDRFRGREAIARLLEQWCASRDLAAIEQMLSNSGACWSVYRTIEEVVRCDARFVSNDNPAFEKIVHPHLGRFTIAGAVVRIEGEERKRLAPAPFLGQHTKEVLQRVLGLTDSEIAHLRDNHIIGPPTEFA